MQNLQDNTIMKIQESDKDDHSLKPESLLHIYYLEGKIVTAQELNVKSFIGNWEEDGFSFLFFLRPEQAVVDSLLEKNPRLTLLDTYQMTYRDWQGGNLDPLHIGRFLFSPPWCEPKSHESAIPVTLDSGVVFGNGTHPTTATCLTAIEIACHGNRVDTMLDLGTGTGVLALAAAKLGCRKVAAVDFNLLACRTARQNVLLNGLTGTILVANGKAEELLVNPTDLLVANIHYDVMQHLIHAEGFLKQKWFILSGLLNSETENILRELSAMPVHILKKWNDGGVWNTVLGITEAN